MMLLSALVAIRSLHAAGAKCSYPAEHQVQEFLNTKESILVQEFLNKNKIRKFYTDEPLWLFAGKMVCITCMHMLPRT